MIKNLFKNYFINSDKSKDLNEDNKMIINVLALLIEASSIDGNIQNEETEKIKELVSDYFNLNKENIDKLYQRAKVMQKDSVSFHNFTTHIHKDYNYKQKIDILEMFWEVILVDGIEHDFESNLMRRICGLLHLKDIDNGIAKKRVLMKNKIK